MSPLVFASDLSEYNEKPNSKLPTSNYVIVDIYYSKQVVPTKAVPTVLIRKTRSRCSRRLITLRDRSCIITRKQISKQETISSILWNSGEGQSPDPTPEFVTACAVATSCCISDVPSQWERPNFDPPQF